MPTKPRPAGPEAGAFRDLKIHNLLACREPRLASRLAKKSVFLANPAKANAQALHPPPCLPQSGKAHLHILDLLANRYQRDDAFRFDHLLLSPELAHRLKRAGVDQSVRRTENASHHSPAWAFLKRALL